MACTTKPDKHHAATFALREGTYEIGEVTGNNTDGYFCDITVTADEYVALYNTDFGKHTLLGDNTKPLTLKYVEGKWVAQGHVTFNVECKEELVPVQVVIYRNGDTTTPYKTVSLDSQVKGTILDLTALNISDYYTANYTGRYDFYGWYNDGGWNDYKNNTANPPAGLTEIKVNGWTNIKCMVYDYEKVVYFQSAEALAAYQGDHSKTEGLLYSTTVRKGSELPTADAPAATRAGYTFLFWSREGQTGDVTGQTVDGWTNLYANWEKNTYTVTYTDGVDGEEVFADQVYTAEFEDTTPAFEGTPTREGYVFDGWNPEVAETVTESVTYVATWKELFPVKVVIYRNGDTTKAYKTISLGKQPKDTVIDLTALNIGDYYTANYTGKYDFYGWYNDGRWNDYKKDITKPLAGLTEIKVNGWTNIICMVYDYEKVVYFQSAEALAAYQGDHSKTEGLLYSTTVRKGSELPTADAPAATRAGYTFLFWSREGQTGDVTGQTVNGWTNLYANWEKNTYTVTYTDGVDGEEVFADQVYTAEFEDATPAFEGTPTRKGYVFQGWDPEVAETVTGNATYTAKWELDKPTREMILETLGKIRVECVKDGSGHAVKEYAASVGGYTAVTMGDRDGRYTVTVTIPAGMYVDQYGLDTEMDHYLAAGEQAEKKVVLEYYNSEWKIVSGTLPVTFKVTCQTYTVTYTDGVEDEEVFADQVYTDLLSGTATPAFNGTPTRKGYVFAGWNPAVAETVTANATYVATWKVDANNNGIPDDEEDKYTVTYTDGVENEEVFADQVYADLLSGTATPKFNGTPTRKGYVFGGWNPTVAETVTANATYVATWKVDANNNGIPDDEEEKYTVIYTDGVNGAAFADQVYEGLLSGDVTPRFNGTPTRKGYTFNGWSPKVANNVTKSVTYTATWKAVSSSVKDGKDSVAKTGDSGIVLVLGGVMLFSLCGAVAVSVYDRKRKQG